MALRNIVTEGDDVLKKKCREVVKFDDRLFTLLDDITETLADSDGVGLAAPQVGILRRITVIDVGEGPIEFINPVILEKRGSKDLVEGCLSCPGEFGIVERPEYVKTKAYDRNGNEFIIEGEGLLAQAMCHEFDHLDGIIFKERAKRLLTKEELESMQEDRED